MLQDWIHPKYVLFYDYGYGSWLQLSLRAPES